MDDCDKKAADAAYLKSLIEASDSTIRSLRWRVESEEFALAVYRSKLAELEPEKNRED